MKRLTLILSALMLTAPVQAMLFQDNFDSAWDDEMTFIDYKGWAEGDDTSIGAWDGFLGAADTLVAYNYVNGLPYSLGEILDSSSSLELNGVLLLSSKNATWDQDNNNGALLYKDITGDFIAEVEIVSRDYWWKHVGGLMVRAENSGMDIDMESWLALSQSPVDEEGNLALSIVDGQDQALETGEYTTATYLQIERQGDTFYLRTSTDGIHWTSLPGLEDGVVRTDLPDTVQVGIWQSTSGGIVGTMMFDNFTVVPEPATVALMGLGGLALVCLRRKS